MHNVLLEIMRSMEQQAAIPECQWPESQQLASELILNDLTFELPQWPIGRQQIQHNLSC